MPKTLSAEEKAAALAAGVPPQSEHYPADVDWHRAQDDWLARWQPGTQLPDPKDSQRRTMWNALSKKGSRHFEAAEAERAQRGSSSRDPPPPEAAPPLPRSPEAQPQDAAPAAAAPSGKRKPYDTEWEQDKLRKILYRRGVTVKTSWTNARLIQELAAHANPKRARKSGATSVAMPPEQPALEHASAAVHMTHDLREQCRALGIEYSISESADQLQEKLHAAR
jgi:hypothetical protein